MPESRRGWYRLPRSGQPIIGLAPPGVEVVSSRDQLSEHVKSSPAVGAEVSGVEFVSDEPQIGGREPAAVVDAGQASDATPTPDTEPEPVPAKAGAKKAPKAKAEGSDGD